jgi:hypothetical protein
MAEVETANVSFLQGKWGPLPVWAWGTLGLVIAYLVSKYRTSKSSSKDAGQDTSTATTPTAQAEGQAVAPQFIIEENEAPEYNVQTVTTGGHPGEQAHAPTPVQAPPVSAPVPTPAPNPPVSHPPVSTPPSKATPPKAKPPIEYRVPAGSGESFSSIAKKFGYRAGGQALYTYNITSSPHSAAAKNTMKARGPNLIYGNELIYIPQS